MDEALVKKLDETFQAKLAARQGKAAGPKAPEGAMMAFTLPSLGSFCKVAPGVVKGLLGVLDSFSWFIPDKLENPARAFLETLDETLLPNICPKP